MKIDIRSLTENQIIEFFLDKGFDSYRGKQVYEWIWKKSVYSFDDTFCRPSPLNRRATSLVASFSAPG